MVTHSWIIAKAMFVLEVPILMHTKCRSEKVLSTKRKKKKVIINTYLKTSFCLEAQQTPSQLWSLNWASPPLWSPPDSSFIYASTGLGNSLFRTFYLFALIIYWLDCLFLVSKFLERKTCTYLPWAKDLPYNIPNKFPLKPWMILEEHKVTSGAQATSSAQTGWPRTSGLTSWGFCFLF